MALVSEQQRATSALDPAECPRMDEDETDETWIQKDSKIKTQQDYREKNRKRDSWREGRAPQHEASGARATGQASRARR